MSDRKKVISDLQKARQWVWVTPIECRNIDVAVAIDGALELLAGVPYVFDSNGETACGACGCPFDKAYSICPKCGKAVKWDE